MTKKRAKIEPKVWSWSWQGCTCSHPIHMCFHGGHFFSRLVFAITLAWILNQQGILLAGIPMWVQAILVIAFAAMAKF